MKQDLGYSTEQVENLYKGRVLYHAPEVERLPEELEKFQD